MSRMEFVLALGFALLVMFAVGWLACRAYQRLFRASPATIAELHRVNRELADTREERDAAIDRLQRREREQGGRIKQLEAELEAAMDGLHAARVQAEARTTGQAAN